MKILLPLALLFTSNVLATEVSHKLSCDVNLEEVFYYDYSSKYEELGHQNNVMSFERFIKSDADVLTADQILNQVVYDREDREYKFYPADGGDEVVVDRRLPVFTKDRRDQTYVTARSPLTDIAEGNYIVLEKTTSGAFGEEVYTVKATAYRNIGGVATKVLENEIVIDTKEDTYQTAYSHTPLRAKLESERHELDSIKDTMTNDEYREKRLELYDRHFKGMFESQDEKDKYTTLLLSCGLR